jgi:hypothetical protein
MGKFYIIVSTLMFGFFLMFGEGSFVFAQTLEVPLVLTAKGTGFTITKNGKAYSYNAAHLPQQRIVLGSSDLLQTGKGDFVQVALLGSDAILSVGENTNIMYSGSIKQDIIKLIYGRVRVNAKGKKPVVIEGGSSAAVISSGDSNVDYTVLPGVQGSQRPVLRVSSFPNGHPNGVIVLPKAGDESYGRIAVNSGETLLIDPVMKNTERVKLDKSIAAYWEPYITRDVLAISTKGVSAAMRSTQPVDPYDPLSAYPTTTAYPNTASTYPSSSSSAAGSPYKGQQSVNTTPPASAPDFSSFVDPEYPTQGDVEIFHSDTRIAPFDYRQSTINLKTGGIIAGLLTMTGGIAMQSAMYFMKEDMNKDMNKLIFNLGYAPIGLGAFTLLASYFYHTPNVNQP